MKTQILMVVLLLVLLLAVSGFALANGIVERPREVLSGGASNSSAGDVTLRATLGQPVVGIVSGGGVTLGQGFWCGAPYHLYMPLVTKDW
jgi:hypothetical protein